MLYILGNPQKRGANIASAVLTRSKIRYIRGEKHGIKVIRESSLKVIRPFLNGPYSHDKKCTHGYETNVRRTISTIKRNIGIEMSI